MPAADNALIAPYERTQYRVRLPRGGHAVIRVHRPLPVSLQPLLPDPAAMWVFITAWNPHSRLLPVGVNRACQRQLLARLHRLEPVPRIAAGIGVGPADTEGRRWREPSLFVVGIDMEHVDALMQVFKQHAVILGTGNGPATLHWNP